MSSSTGNAVAMQSSDQLVRGDWESLGKTLLSEGLVLTALELHTELLEGGRNVACLRDYFSNPGNFEHAIPHPVANVKTDMNRTASLSTFDSLDQYSDDGREGDDKVAVLEFELRKAYESIKSLRGSLTQASSGTAGNVVSTPASSEEPIKPHEVRALNYLVHEYLIETNSKLTAITFTDENGDQNFEDWDDVGLNISKPLGLLHFFRHHANFSLSDQEQITRIRELEKEVLSLNGQILAQRRENESLLLGIKKRRSSRSEEDVHGNQPLHHGPGPSLSNEYQRKAFTPEARRTHTVLHQRRSSNPFDSSTAPLDNVFAAPPHLGKTTSLFIPPRLQLDEQSMPEPVGTNPFDEDNEDVPVSQDSVDQGQNSSAGQEDEEQEEQEEKEEQDEKRSSRQTPSTLQPNESTSTLTTDDNGRDDFAATAVAQDGEGIKHQMSVAFRQELLATLPLETDSRIGLEVAKLSDPGLDVIRLFGRCLPHIVPNVILAKREELIPILLCVLSKHSDPRERDKLLNIMFNLIKRPDRTQRQVIMNGCVAFAKLNGPTLVESELLPQIWEQINHKYFERRLLVAESCGVLAPHIPVVLRGSLVLSMLQQMLEDDKAESVRKAVVRALGVLVAFVDDEDKFKLCWELMLKAINDTSQLVVTAALTVFLPALAAWAFELGRLESDVILYFFMQLHTCIKQVFRSGGESGATECSQQYLCTLIHLVPWHCASLLLSGPYAADLSSSGLQPKEVKYPHPFSKLLDLSVIIGDQNKLGLLVAGLEQELARELTPWRELVWFQEECLQRILKATETLGFSQPAVLYSLTTLLCTYCEYLGHTFTHKIIKPFFELVMKTGQDGGLGTINSGKATAALPLYAAGVLACFHQDQALLASFLRDTIVELSLSFIALDSLQATVTNLKMGKKHGFLLVAVMKELVNHSAVQVRRYAANLLGLMIREMDERLVVHHVVKMLLYLASDKEIVIQIETIVSLGVVMETLSNREALEQVHQQFEHFVRDEKTKGDFLLYSTVLQTVAKISPNADPVFRDKFIIPLLMDAALGNNSAPNATQQLDIARMLFDAYQGISGCFVPANLISTYVVPGMKALLEDCKAVDKDRVPTVRNLLKEYQSKLTEKNFSGNSEGGQAEEHSSNILSKLNPFDRIEFSVSPKMPFPFRKKT